jgi:serine/threonine protein kinase
VRRQLHNLQVAAEPDDSRTILKKHVCFYVMNFASYGELYRLVEVNEQVSDNLVRYLFRQLLQGLNELHNSGFVHRDIKPENLLINKDLKLVIADFNFAKRLEKFSPTSFSPLVSHDYQVGSETYNAPELWHDSTQVRD